MPITYLNGRYVPHKRAVVSVDDRGYVFSDGIYEVAAVQNGIILDWELHLKRLHRSLGAVKIAAPCSDAALRNIIHQVMAHNGMENGYFYIQVTRGVAPRAHAFPKKPVRPSLMVSVLSMKPPTAKEYKEGVAVITRTDLRWLRRDIKSISLLPNIMAKQEAVEHKVKEAWLVMPDGNISEGSSTNAFIVTQEGVIRTHPADNSILGGITRDVLLMLARKDGINIDETPFTCDDVARAAEAFLSSTTAGALPVVTIDGKKIGSGTPGPVTKRLIELFNEHCARQT